jgi:hypothetical protein
MRGYEFEQLGDENILVRQNATLDDLAEITDSCSKKAMTIDGGDHQINVWSRDGEITISVQGTGENITLLKCG